MTWVLVHDRLAELKRDFFDAMCITDSRCETLTFDIQIDNQEFVINVGGESEIKERLFDPKFEEPIKVVFWSCFRFTMMGEQWDRRLLLKANAFNPHPPEGFEQTKVTVQPQYVPKWPSLIEENKRYEKEREEERKAIQATRSERRESTKDQVALLSTNRFTVLDPEQADEPLRVLEVEVTKEELIKFRALIDSLIDLSNR